MRIIYTKKGEEIYLSDKGYKLVSQLRNAFGREPVWHINANGYVAAKIKQKEVLLARYLVNARNGVLVDHKNHNKLDNRIENLRVCTRTENRRNCLPARNKSSRYRGVLKVRGKFRAKVRKNGKDYHLGYFASEESAAKAYNDFAIKLFGEFAYLNNVDAMKDTLKGRV